MRRRCGGGGSCSSGDGAAAAARVMPQSGCRADQPASRHRDAAKKKARDPAGRRETLFTEWRLPPQPQPPLPPPLANGALTQSLGRRWLDKIGSSFRRRPRRVSSRPAAKLIWMAVGRAATEHGTTPVTLCQRPHFASRSHPASSRCGLSFICSRDTARTTSKDCFHVLCRRRGDCSVRLPAGGPSD